MILYKKIFFLTILLCVLLKVNCKDCVLNLPNDLTPKHPLLLDPYTSEFIYPTDQFHYIFIKEYDEVFLACTGADNRFNNTKNVKELLAKCVDNHFVAETEDGRLNQTFYNLSCTDYPKSSARKTGRLCTNLYDEYEIGFQISRGFVRLFTSCVDWVTNDTMYSHFEMVNSIAFQQKGSERPLFSDGGFYAGGEGGSPLDYFYMTANQKIMFKSILGDDRYINTTSNMTLSKGDLAAEGDFFYMSQQRATFYYMNVAPQWMIFNNENWNKLEQSVRDFAASSRNNLQVYTGVFNTSSLNSTQGVYKKLNLNYGRLTIPDLFWKVVYDKPTKRAIAFVGHNNPYETNIRIICKDICKESKWKLSWDAKNYTKGYSYCCDVNDFRKTVRYLPEMEVDGLLGVGKKFIINTGNGAYQNTLATFLSIFVIFLYIL